MYIEQSDKHSCVPIAIMNALRWAGRDCPYDLGWFRKICKCGSACVGGTLLSDLDNAVKFFGLAEEYYKNPPFSLINVELDLGSAALITYFNTRKGKEYGHSMLCVNRTPHHYKVINWARSRYPVQQILKQRLKYILSKKHKKQTETRIYFIERNHG